MDQAHEKHRNELLGWYSTSALPEYRAEKRLKNTTGIKTEFANNEPKKKKTQRENRKKGKNKRCG